MDEKLVYNLIVGGMLVGLVLLLVATFLTVLPAYPILNLNSINTSPPLNFKEADSLLFVRVNFLEQHGYTCGQIRPFDSRHRLENHYNSLKSIQLQLHKLTQVQPTASDTARAISLIEAGNSYRYYFLLTYNLYHKKCLLYIFGSALFLVILGAINFIREG